MALQASRTLEPLRTLSLPAFGFRSEMLGGTEMDVVKYHFWINFMSEVPKLTQNLELVVLADGLAVRLHLADELACSGEFGFEKASQPSDNQSHHR